MSNNLIYYEEFPKFWDPDRLKRLFDVMIIGGIVGTGAGIVFNNRRVISASAASAGAGIVGQLILSLFGY